MCKLFPRGKRKRAADMAVVVTIACDPLWETKVHHVMSEVIHVFHRDLSVTIQYNIKPYGAMPVLLGLCDGKHANINILQKLPEVKQATNTDVLMVLTNAEQQTYDSFGASFMNALHTNTRNACAVCEWHHRSKLQRVDEQHASEEEVELIDRIHFDMNTYVICHELGHLLGLSMDDITPPPVQFYTKQVHMTSINKLSPKFNSQSRLRLKQSVSSSTNSTQQ